MTRPGVTNLKSIRKPVIRRHADLVRWGDRRLEGEMSAIKYVDLLTCRLRADDADLFLLMRQLVFKHCL